MKIGDRVSLVGDPTRRATITSDHQTYFGFDRGDPYKFQLTFETGTVLQWWSAEELVLEEQSANTKLSERLSDPGALGTR
jgi:hypothetical protein